MSDFEQVDRWLNWKLMNQGRAQVTIDKYRRYLSMLSDYLSALSPSVTLLEADREHLLHFTGLHMHQKGMSPRSRQAVVAAVKGFYTWAKKNGLVSQQPADQLEYPKAGKRLPDVATLRTVERLLMAPDISTLKGIRDCTMIAMLAGTALRVAALCNLNESSLIWTQIDGKDRLLIKARQKGDRDHVVPAPYDVWLLVRAYLGHPDLAVIDRTLPDGDQVLFVSYNNMRISPENYHGEARRISPRSVDDMIKKYGRDLGLPDKQLHAHALRHLYGTELAEDGTSLREIQDLLGHEDPKTTEIYTRLATRRLARTVDKSNPLAKINSPVRDLANMLGD